MKLFILAITFVALIVAVGALVSNHIQLQIEHRLEQIKGGNHANVSIEN